MKTTTQTTTDRASEYRRLAGEHMRQAEALWAAGLNRKGDWQEQIAREYVWDADLLESRPA